MEYVKLDISTRFVAFGALGAFILSILVGLVSKNPIGIVFVRAVVSSLVFGLILFGAAQVIKRYIPEFFFAGKNEEESAEARGQADELQDFSVVARKKVGEGKKPSDLKNETVSPSLGAKTGLKVAETEFGGGLTDEDDLPSLDKLFVEDEELHGTVEEVEKRSSAPPGDYIDVGKVRFPNEPEILAKAVKQVMNQD